MSPVQQILARKRSELQKLKQESTVAAKIL